MYMYLPDLGSAYYWSFGEIVTQEMKQLKYK